ncbi:MAG: 3-dehydroquinate synthase [Ardenticatenaceae bacterium]|nr:3-dehydroquinate synthase [Ardenticatenaceae bacterium]
MAIPNIILTGFMGTGKSSVGQLLAQQLQRPFIDTDTLIVQRDGRSIAQIFAEDGEAAFRNWERTVALELGQQQGLIIATGGRLMLDEENAVALEASGLVFCLTAAPQTILSRIKDDDQRPLLNVPNPAERIAQLLEIRRELYGRFPQISTEGKTAEQVAEEIVLAASQPPGGLEPPGGSMNPTRLPVTHPTGQYDVLVGADLLPNLAELAQIRGPIALITDSHVGPLHAHRLGDVACTVTIPAGEQHKTLATVQTIYDQLLAAGIDRQATIVALGGGVVGDVAGFVAATYLRGVNFVQCPTSLLAMVDASVGGKTGVDMPQGKNLVGAFKQPTAVLADITTLQTLPSEEFTAGMAEVIKHGLISNPELFGRLETGDWRLNNQSPIANLQSLVSTAIEVKRNVVQEDPFEKGVRATLNLGHTFGHAIEQVSGYRIRHGEGVALGLVAAANLSARLEHCDPALQGRIEVVLQAQGLPTRIPAEFTAETLYQAMFTDKKKAGGKLRFILLRDVGEVFVTGDVAAQAVLASLTAVKSI